MTRRHSSLLKRVSLSQSFSTSKDPVPYLSHRLESHSSHHSTTGIRPLHVVFLHMDLGIGGAEQLILQLARSSQQLGHRVDILTTRCDADHCFDVVAPNGPLFSHVHIWGRWLPHDLFGLFRTFCSSLRVLYLAVCLSRKKSPDVIVVDVLSTPLPLLLLTDAALLFYCHFPDQLLKRSDSVRTLSGLRHWYESVMNTLESRSMQAADTICVNSKFTKSVVYETFPLLKNRELTVLYPALNEDEDKRDEQTDNQDKHATNENIVQPKQYMIVSLNRFERKKKLHNLIHGIAWIRQHHPEVKLPRVVIAGGYDVRCLENVQYRAELQELRRELELCDVVDFQSNVSEQQRHELFQTALAVVYTPTLEHFGIVPLEAMQAGTPVVAVRSGGPMETVVHGVTGLLCEDDAPHSFGTSILELLRDPERAAAMGRAGQQHVWKRFGRKRLRTEWKQIIEETVMLGRHRLQQTGQYRLARSAMYIWDALKTLLFCYVLTVVLRATGLLHSNESIWRYLNKKLSGRGEEL